MSDKKFRFTDNRLRRIKSSAEGKRRYFYDTEAKGLRLQVTPAGTKTFQFQTWSPGGVRPQTITLGKYPSVSLATARKKASQCMAEVHSGKNIEEEKKKLREEDTFSEIFDVWLDQFAKVHKKSWQEDENRYNLYMRKQFGNKPLSWFSPEKVRKWHKKITQTPKQRGTGNISQTTANRALALLSTVFNQAIPHIGNPCKGVRKFREKSRDRFLQPAELKRFFEALEQEDTPALLRDYILISLYTGGRRSNILSMEWKEISFDRKLWKIPSHKSKNGEPMAIPLVEEALDILKRRNQELNREYRQKNTIPPSFVFPGRIPGRHYSEPKTAWKSFVKKLDLKDIRIHDLRRTLGSWQTITGASTTIVGKTLGHKSPEATAIYARLNLDPVRISMDNAVKAMRATKNQAEVTVSLKKHH